jgi:uncharacterized protein (DUF1330 family)
MSAYWVARAKINDPVEYKKYTDQVPGIIARYGGKVLARGGRFQIMEGPDKFQRFVVIEFPSFEQGVACFASRPPRSAGAARARSRPSWWRAASLRSRSSAHLSRPHPEERCEAMRLEGCQLSSFETPAARAPQDEGGRNA